MIKMGALPSCKSSPGDGEKHLKKKKYHFYAIFNLCGDVLLKRLGVLILPHFQEDSLHLHLVFQLLCVVDLRKIVSRQDVSLDGLSCSIMDTHTHTHTSSPHELMQDGTPDTPSD